MTTHSETHRGAGWPAEQLGIDDPLLLASLLGGMDAALFAVDCEGRVTHWNKEAERVLGWTRSEAVGRQGLGGWVVREADAADVQRRLLAVAGIGTASSTASGAVPAGHQATTTTPTATSAGGGAGGASAPAAPGPRSTPAAPPPGTAAPAHPSAGPGAGGARQMQDFPLVTKGGDRLLVRAQTAAVRDAAGRPAGAYCAFNEAHTQLDLERRLALSEALLAGSSWAVVLVDADLRAVAVNEPAAGALAVSPVEMLGEPLGEFFGNGLEELESALEYTLAGEPPAAPVELWVTLHRDGSYEDEQGDLRGGLPGGPRRCWLSGFLPLGSPMATQPSPLGVAWVFQDVTRSRRQAQRSARQQFRDSQLSRAMRAAAECEDPMEAAGVQLDFALAGFAEHALLDVFAAPWHAGAPGGGTDAPPGPLPARLRNRAGAAGPAREDADGGTGRDRDEGASGREGAAPGRPAGPRLVRMREAPGPTGAGATATVGMPVEYRPGHPAREALTRGAPVRATGGVPYPDGGQAPGPDGGPAPAFVPAGASDAGPPWAVAHKWPRDAVHALCVVLRSRGRNVGVVTFLRGPGRRGFDREDTGYAEDVALRVAAAVDLTGLVD